MSQAPLFCGVFLLLSFEIESHCNSRIGNQRQKDHCKFETSLIYIVLGLHSKNLSPKKSAKPQASLGLIRILGLSPTPGH